MDDNQEGDDGGGKSISPGNARDTDASRKVFSTS